MCGKEQERDELRAMFTGWLESLAYRVRKNYLRDNSRNPLSVSLDEIAEDQFAVHDVQRNGEPDSFDFEEEQLSAAFANLPAMKKQILTMLFVLEMEPEKIASELGCTVQNVYNQRSLALKRLRKALEGGEEHD
ncbi:MAG: sigma-70 family RNA polymerase sigma factor [Acutalibacter sp.]|jgi:RNA polymerase sigma factor (sigma-70 family)|uniref:sigma-70 family RNA polymerase sigma factor n=1 Tax=Acutalibacter sp. TaxID=1918636 RepID=UPI00216FD27E|nr:sigma-70 family RNA polymerase sigma factor [Acutalibacter sp.]MCI9224159.1 sigma-70 family RNA polymerase sigma factor [Acutalibacter sp.]